MEKTVTSILVIIVIIFVIFLILRELNSWYWKINERVSLKKQEIALLREILNELKGKPSNKKENISNDTAKIHKKQYDNKTDVIVKNKINIETENEKQKKRFNEIEKEKEKEKKRFDEIEKIKKNLQSDEVIIENKKTKELGIIKKEKYDMEKDLHISTDYRIVYYPE